MCVRGQAQKILPNLTLDQMNKYSEVRIAVESRFDPRDEKPPTRANCGIKDYISLNSFRSTGIRSTA